MDYRKLLEEHIRATSDKGGMSPEEVLELAELDRKIRAIDLEGIVAERLAKMTPLEKVIDALKAGRPLERRAKARKVHHHTKRARKRRRERIYYKEVLKPKRTKRLAEELRTPGGWWEHLNGTWKLMKVPVTMTFEEFEEVIWPATLGKGLVPVFFRYDKKGDIELGNLLVRESTSREVLFDGKEFSLRQLGYIL